MTIMKDLYAKELETKMSTLTVKMSTNLYNKFVYLCLNKGVSVSLVVRRFIEAEVEVEVEVEVESQK